MYHSYAPIVRCHSLPEPFYQVKHKIEVCTLFNFSTIHVLLAAAIKTSNGAVELEGDPQCWDLTLTITLYFTIQPNELIMGSTRNEAGPLRIIGPLVYLSLYMLCYTKALVLLQRGVRGFSPRNQYKNT